MVIVRRIAGERFNVRLPATASPKPHLAVTAVALHWLLEAAECSAQSEAGRGSAVCGLRQRIGTFKC
jgi:hypothetical protein